MSAELRAELLGSMFSRASKLLQTLFRRCLRRACAFSQGESLLTSHDPQRENASELEAEEEAGELWRARDRDEP